MICVLDSEVLVLNRLWQAVNVVRARRALTLVYVGRGKVVGDDFATWEWDRWVRQPLPASAAATVHGVSLSLAVPRVIQVLEFDRLPRPRVRLTRSNVYLRDGHRCQYCGSPGRSDQLTLDHVLPRSRGGATVWQNVVAACSTCNGFKRDRRPEEAGMQLLRSPGQPRWHRATAMRTTRPPPSEWLPFLQWMPGASTVGAVGNVGPLLP